MSEHKGAAWTLRDVLTVRVNLADIERIAKECGYVLKGEHPAIQGAALAELLARWMKGHEPCVRERLLLQHIKHVRELLEGQ